MRKLSLWCAFLAAVFLAESLPAQTAQEIIDKAYKNYGEMPGYTGIVSMRQIRANVSDAEATEALKFDILSTFYVKLELRWRNTGDWLLLRTTIPFLRGENQAPRVTGLSNLGGTKISTITYLSNRAGHAQQMPPNDFSGVLRSFTSPQEPLIYSQFAGDNSDWDGNAWGVIAPVIHGEEKMLGENAYRITARLISGGRVILWISKDSNLLLRMLTMRTEVAGFRPRVSPSPSPSQPEDVFSSLGGGAPSQESSGESSRSGPMRIFVDSVYTNQQTDALISASFTLPPVARADPEIAGRAGFTDESEVIGLMPLLLNKKGVMGKATPNDANSDGSAKLTPAPVENTAEKSAASSSPTDQALTSAQMSGIVLIDGDQSAGSGFMTKIKGADFVVTNLHVVGGNKKFTLKTLRGVEVPVLGIFGAVGSDIAILRIAKGEGDLKLADDVFTSAKIGDRVVVVGNRLGGGVATQTPGNVVGIGPSRVEVSANFAAGNSGSPIVDLGTGEVIGIASYAETRRVDVEDSSDSRRPRVSTGTVEKRWFGYRVDAVTKWEAIDLAKWNAQADRIDKFRGLSEALVAFLRFDFRTARQHPRLAGIMDGFETRYRATSGNSITAATEVKDLFRVVRTISGDGMGELTTGDYYDYFRTCLYWENSISAQLEYRKAIIEVLKKYENNSSSYVSRMRNGG